MVLVLAVLAVLAVVVVVVVVEHREAVRAADLAADLGAAVLAGSAEETRREAAGSAEVVLVDSVEETRREADSAVVVLEVLAAETHRAVVADLAEAVAVLVDSVEETLREAESAVALLDRREQDHLAAASSTVFWECRRTKEWATAVKMRLQELPTPIAI